MEVDDAAQIYLYSTEKPVKIENIFYYIFITSTRKKEIVLMRNWKDITKFLISVVDPTLW